MNITDDVGCYARPPLHLTEGIAVFSPTDAYVRNYERISEDHLKHFEATGHNPFMSEAHWREVEDSTASLLLQHVSPGARLLDVGVGMGRLLERFPQYRRFGMDISLRYLKYAQDKGIEVCMARIEDMPYKPGFFDACVCTDVLEHVLDLNDAVRRILATLREDGLLIVRVPFREDLSPYLADGFPYDMVHLRNFDQGSLRLFFEKIMGLEVLQFSYAGHAEGRSRLEAGLPLLGAVWRRVVHLSRLLGARAHAAACRRFLQPVEVNVVVRNRHQPA
jgi:SAM-dependent methyltransferase